MFETSIQLLGSEHYLGSLEVVDKLVRQFVASVLAAEHVDAVHAEVNRISAIFSGLDQQYTAPNNWLTKEQIGRSVANHYALELSQSLFNVMRTLFAMFISDLIEMLEQHSEDELAAKTAIESGIEKLVVALLGIGQVGDE